MKRAVLVLAMLLAATAPAWAQADEPDCKDHPLFPRVPNYHISGCDTDERASFDFDARGGAVKAEGRYWKIDYWLKEDVRQAAAPLEIARRYRDVVIAKRGTVLLEQLDSSGRTLTAKVPAAKGSGATWLQLYITMDGEAYSLVVVEEGTAPK